MPYLLFSIFLFEFHLWRLSRVEPRLSTWGLFGVLPKLKTGTAKCWVDRLPFRCLSTFRGAEVCLSFRSSKFSELSLWIIYWEAGTWNCFRGFSWSKLKFLGKLRGGFSSPFIFLATLSLIYEGLSICSSCKSSLKLCLSGANFDKVCSKDWIWVRGLFRLFWESDLSLLKQAGNFYFANLVFEPEFLIFLMG